MIYEKATVAVCDCCGKILIALKPGDSIPYENTIPNNVQYTNLREIKCGINTEWRIDIHQNDFVNIGHSSRIFCKECYDILLKKFEETREEKANNDLLKHTRK